MAAPARTYDALIFDFDGTLVDSDAELVRAFVELGVAEEKISFGHAIGEELELLGLTLDDYADTYRDHIVAPFPGVDEVVPGLGRWALCSNKHPRSGLAELARLGWQPEVAVFADHFDWAHKRLDPVLEMMGVSAARVAMIGDSGGDATCAAEVGCDMYWAGWNPRVVAAQPEGIVLERPDELLGLFG